MYPSLMPPQATTPAITFFVVASKAHSDTGANLHKLTRFQTNVYAETHDVVETIAAAMINALQGYTGTVSGQDIVYITQDYEMDTYEPEVHLYRKILDFKVVHKGA